MMFVLITLLGLASGWFIHWLSDYLPRFAIHQPTRVSATVQFAPLALLQLVRGQFDSEWGRLYAVVEAASAGIALYFWMRLGISRSLLLYFVTYCFFVLVTIIDLKYRVVLNVLVYPAAIIVLLVQTLDGQIALLNVLLGGVFAFVIFYGAAHIRPNGLGGGDIKLATLIGLIFGFPNVLFALIAGAGATAVFIGIVLGTRRGGLKTQIPYAPFLCFGALVVLLFNPVWIESRMLF